METTRFEVLVRRPGCWVVVARGLSRELARAEANRVGGFSQPEGFDHERFPVILEV